MTSALARVIPDSIRDPEQEAPCERGFLFVAPEIQSAGAPRQVKLRSMPFEYLLVAIMRALIEVAGYLMRSA